MRGEDSFGVDHYKPKSLFPDELLVYSNLFYSCNVCNRRKGGFWPNLRQREMEIFIPNPCDHKMFEHVRFEGLRVVPRTDAGKWCVELLSLNDSEFLEYRELINGLIINTQLVYRGQIAVREKLAKKLERSADESERSAIASKVEELRIAEAKNREYLSRLTGIPTSYLPHV